MATLSSSQIHEQTQEAYLDAGATSNRVLAERTDIGSGTGLDPLLQSMEQDLSGCAGERCSSSMV